MNVEQMMATHPGVQGAVQSELIRCIEECYRCAQTCNACADACLGETKVADLTLCIRLNLDCADICLATGAIASRRTGANESVVRRLIHACAEACRMSAVECEKHAKMHEHCRVCAEACRSCEEACQAVLQNSQGVH